jgi:hypothetical protein
MKALLALLALLFCACAPSGAQAAAQHPPAFFFCPFGAAVPDGCGQAPQAGLTPGMSGEILHTDCFTPGGFINQVAGTTTNYTSVRPPYNVPACDYPVGKYSPDSALLDPATVSIPECTYEPTSGANGNGVFLCNITNANPVTISGVNFGPVGSHGCTALVIEGTGAAPVSISNNKFLNDGNCAFAQSFAFFIEQRNGGQVYDVVSNTFDGNSDGSTIPLSTACPNSPTNSLDCSISNAVNMSSLTMQYDAVFNFSNRPINFSNGGTGLNLSYNFGSRWDARGPLSHSEFLDPGGTAAMPVATVLHNNFVDATGVVGEGAAMLPLGLTDVHSVTAVKIDGNVNIGSFVGGMARGITQIVGCIGGAPPTGSTCDTTTPGSNFYVVSVTAPEGVNAQVGSGMVLGSELAPTSCTSSIGINSGAFVAALATSVSGTTSAGIGGGFLGGPGAVFGMDLDFTGFSVTGSISGNTLTITGAIPINSVALQQGYPISGTGVTPGTVITSSTIIPGVVGTYTVNNSQTVASETLNISVPNGSAGFYGAPPGLKCTITNPSISPEDISFGGVGLVDSETSEVIGNYTDESTYNGEAVTFNAGGGTCATPTLFASNLDMSGLKSVAAMNDWQAGGAAGVGCSVTAPVNLTIPVISGTPQVGNTLTASDGTWETSPSSNVAASFDFQWLANGAAVSGQTFSSFPDIAVSNVSTTGSAVTFTFAAQSAAPTGTFTTSGFTGAADVYNFSTPQTITASTTTTATIASTLTTSVSGSELGQIQLPLTPFVGDTISVTVNAFNSVGNESLPATSAAVGPVTAPAQ